METFSQKVIMDITLKIDARSFERAFHLVPKALNKEIKDGMDHASRKFMKTWRQNFLQGPPGVRGASGHGLFGKFTRKMLFFGDTDNFGFEVSTDSKIARQHEFGGKVEPRVGKLAVPLSARNEMFTASGKLRKIYRSPKDLPNVEPIKLNGKVFLARIKKKGKGITPLYVLKNSVKLKPRLGFYKTFNSMSPEMYRILNKSINRALDTSWLGN